MKIVKVKILTGMLPVWIMLAVAPAQSPAQDKLPQTTKETFKGAAQVTTEQLNGTVVQVEGNTLLVRMSTGDLRTFQVPASRRFIVDGKELTVGELKPGTSLTATVTTTTTSLVDRTTTVGTGTVWFVSGNTVILTLPNNENRMYKVPDSYKFIVDGKPADVSALRKGMRVSAEKIVEEPRVEIVSNTAVTGKAPTERAAAQPSSQPAARPADGGARPAAAGAKAEPQASKAPAAPAREPTQVAQATPPPRPATPPAAPNASESLPKSGSLLPLIGLAGLILVIASLGLRKLA